RARGGGSGLPPGARYRAGRATRHRRRGVRATGAVEDEPLASFSKAAPTTAVATPQPLAVDRDEWVRRARAASGGMRRHPAVLDSDVRLQATREGRYLVNSEGARLITDRTIWGAHVQAGARAHARLMLEDGPSLYGAT